MENRLLSQAPRFLTRLRAGAAAALSKEGRRTAARRAAAQVYEGAIEPLPVLLAASAAAGAAVLLALDSLMRPNAIAAYLNPVFSYAITRELAPLAAAIIVALRSGTALAVDIGLRASDANDGGAGTSAGAGDKLFESELLPRAAGIVLAAIVLTACLAAAGLAGGFFVVSLFNRVPVGLRPDAILDAVWPAAALVALGKAALAGVLIAVVSCIQGIRASSAPGGVAKAAGRFALQSALGCAALLVAISLSPLSSAPEPGGDGGDFIVHAASADSYGTRVGSIVRVHGVEVGSVTEVKLVHDPERPDKPVRITMRVSRHGASFLRERTVAHVERIHMGTGVPPFAVPPIDLRTDGSAELASGAIVETVGEETMVESMAKLSREVTAVRKHIDGLSGSFGDLQKITKAMAGTDGAAGRLLHDPATAEGISELVDGARGATSQIQKLLAEAQVLSGQAGPLLADMQGASKEGREALAAASKAAQDLPRMLKAAERTLKLAEELVVNLRAASAYAPELARKVDASIEETNRVVDAAQRSLILRNTLPDRQTPRTEAEVRPPIPLGEAGSE
jgi:ABC-type transporter Mla maintaining outer membrane lipid asymmetry permease subunit MlaE